MRDLAGRSGERRERARHAAHSDSCLPLCGCAAVPHTFSVRKITKAENGLEIAYTYFVHTDKIFRLPPSQKGRRLAPCGQTSDPAFDSPMRQSIEMSAERPE